MKSKLFSLLVTLGLSSAAFAQVEVDVNFDMKHTVGGKESFDRSKFIVLHAGESENDYNDDLGKLDTLMNLYDAYYGRDTGRMRYIADQVKENPSKPGFADPESIKEWAKIINPSYVNNTAKHAYEKGSTITAAQERPFFPDGKHATKQGWFFSQNDSAQEPFGSATGQFMGLFMRDLYGEGGTTGVPRPKYVEVINEPFFPLVDFAAPGEAANATDIFKMHKTVADSIRKYSPNSKIGGFTNAFPDLEAEGFETENKVPFGQWEERWKKFIDEIGSDMDFYSIHLYDFHSIGGKEKLRKGSNMEATMDMIEHYNTMVYGEVKPWVISEYGAQLNDYYAQPWSPKRDWLILKSFSSMMMQFMERPDVIEKTVPFALGKAEFLSDSAAPGFAYPWRMMRRKDEPASRNSNEYVFTEVVKFYELWSDVKGTRVDTKSTDLDLMVDAYVNTADNKAYLILNSLGETNINVNLNEFGLGNSNVTGVKIKHLYLGSDSNPKLDITEANAAPNSVIVNEEGTLIIEYTFDNTLAITETSTESKTYASTYKQAIVADQEIKFTIPNVKVGTHGEAVIRLGVGRGITLSRIPNVKVNGNTVSVPNDYRGDVQNQRDSFFGVLEIPVPYSYLINGNNEITIGFSDAGGFVSSIALQAFDFSREVQRTGIKDRSRAITFNNIDDFKTDGNTLPEFTMTQNASLNLSYATGVINGVEEDLAYVAAQISQVDELGNQVAISDFTLLVPNESDNEGLEGNYNYKIPIAFTNSDPIPASTELPTGHKLVLVLFMSVDDNAGFANANTDIILNPIPDRERSISFDNVASFIPAGGTLPSISYGQDAIMQLSYQTGLTNRVEEDLFYVATLIRQLDELGNAVASSEFVTIAGDASNNTGKLNFTYTIPTEFTNADPIPTSAELPTGHSLVWLVFMATDNNTNFTDANTSVIINAQANRERAVTFDNIFDYLPSGSNLPTFEKGQTVPTTLTYATGVSEDVEEDLSYVAMQVSQLDENFKTVKTSTFKTVVNTDAENADTVSFNYILPTTFDDGTDIPLSSELPTGHKLYLLTFMSVDDDAGFANANTEIKIVKPVRRRKVTFDNVSDYIFEDEVIPTFDFGQIFKTSLSYSTGLKVDGSEEDLSYVAMQVRQLDANSEIVNTSAFDAIVNGNEPNEGAITFNYNLPTVFDDGTAIPITANLPEGHKLLLLIFMAVDDSSGFTDASTEIKIIEPVRERKITFDNVSDFIPDGATLPTFDFGQTFEAKLSYSTALRTDGSEEDLTYIAMQVRQFNENSEIVNTSTFNAVVNGDESNIGTANINYSLPTVFDDGSAIPATANLPEGHELSLLIFMSVDDNAGFVNANTKIAINLANRARKVTFDNLDEYIPEGETLPTFDLESETTLKVSYNTALLSNQIEDLESLTLELRQVDQSFGTVSSTTAVIIADTTADNSGTITADFTLPSVYSNGLPVITTGDLPGGHKLVLVAKLTAENDVKTTEVLEEVVVKKTIKDRDAFVTWDNRNDFISNRPDYPVFKFGETVSFDLSFATPLVNGVEEQIESIRVRIDQLNRSGDVVKRTKSARYLEDSAVTSGSTSIDFQIPTKFKDGSAIPIIRRLPRGHTLRIVIALRTKESKRVAGVKSLVGFRWFNFRINGNENGAKVSESNDNKITMLPNPANYEIVVNNLSEYTSASIYSLSGSLIDTIQLDSRSAFNVSQLNEGVYIVKFFGANKLVKTRKVVVKH